MSGNRAGGIKCAIINKAKHGEDFYSRIGAIGGLKKHPNKGFGSMPREKVVEAGKKGGQIGKRSKNVNL